MHLPRTVLAIVQHVTQASLSSAHLLQDPEQGLPPAAAVVTVPDVVQVPRLQRFRMLKCGYIAVNVVILPAYSRRE